jgi:hypothetical protein
MRKRYAFIYLKQIDEIQSSLCSVTNKCSKFVLYRFPGNCTEHPVLTRRSGMITYSEHAVSICLAYPISNSQAIMSPGVILADVTPHGRSIWKDHSAHLARRVNDDVFDVLLVENNRLVGGRSHQNIRRLDIVLSGSSGDRCGVRSGLPSRVVEEVGLGWV